MKNADRPRPDPRRERLLVVDPRTGSLDDGLVGDLPEHLGRPDLLVVNDAATLPASFRARRAGSPPAPTFELRLAGVADGDGNGESAGGTWWAVLFGDGTWRIPTEHRGPPPAVRTGDVLQVGNDLRARVREISPLSPRLVRLAFDRAGDALHRAFYRDGRPVQYSYLSSDLALWDVQTRFGARPWSVEPASAGRPLTWDTLAALRRRGVALARITHAAGLSATGDPALDARLPLPERYEIPEYTVRAIETARRSGGRVIAVGTTVVRALEGGAAAHGGRLAAGSGITDHVVGPDTPLRIVNGILTGMHEAGSSHLRLLGAFASPSLLAAALARAETEGYLQHEFGDSMLVLPGWAESHSERFRQEPAAS